MCSSLTIMSAATIAPSLPRMSEVFGDLEKAEFLSKLVLTIPAIFIAVGAPIAGLVIDRFGRKTLLWSSMILYGASGSAGFILDDLYMILVSRALLGIAVAGVVTTASTLIGDYFKGEERAKFMGLQSGLMALGGVVFITLGGFLADISWRYPFLIYSISFAFLPFVLLYIYEPQTPRLENFEKNLPDFSIWKGRYLFVFAISFISMVIFYMVPVQIPFYLKELGIESSSKTGLAIASGLVSGAVASINFRWMKRFLSFQGIYAFAFALLAVGFIIISLSSHYLHVVIGLVIGGMGVGLMIPNASLWLMTMAPDQIRGRIMGGLHLSSFTGQFFSPLLMQPFISRIQLSGTFNLMGILMFFFTVLFIILHIRDTKQLKSAP